MKAHNIMEDIVAKYLKEMLERRFDICTCDVCKEDILAYALSRVPAKYVTTDAGAMYMLTEHLKVEQASQILKELVNAINVISKNPRHKISGDKDTAYQLLLNQIKLDRGVDFTHYRESILKRRIALRMQAKKVKNYAEYLHVLVHDSEEYEKLFDVLTINVSSFFRDMDVWNKLKDDIFLRIIQAKKRQFVNRIKIWSAGCAHGEEPHSLAILLYELLEKENFKIRAEIIATDIDKESLRLANAGAYDRNSLKYVSNEYMRRFFIQAGEDKFIIAPQIKELVTFKEENLIHDAGPTGMDMVLCRNVFIYFNRSLQEHLIMKFYNALGNDGFFVMGNSENLLGEARQLFTEIDRRLMIFQKINKI